MVQNIFFQFPLGTKTKLGIHPRIAIEFSGTGEWRDGNRNRNGNREIKREEIMEKILSGETDDTYYKNSGTLIFYPTEEWIAI